MQKFEESKSEATANDRSSVMGILCALSFSHLLNDAIQSLLPAIYPLLKESFQLTFGQIGLITLTFQTIGSIFQPVVGFYTDRNPKPYSLAAGMSCTLAGIILLAMAGSFHAILWSAAMIGLGSAIFHPESSRMARVASGGRHGFAQSFFQVGGNIGTSLGPILAAWIVAPGGREHILWFTLLAATGIIVLSKVGKWYARHLLELRSTGKSGISAHPGLNSKKIAATIFILLVLIFSKFFYLVSMTNYYTFYLIQKFGVSVQASQMYLFLFLVAVAVGTFMGGPIGDRIGRKPVIWVSILGMSPFALMLPYANLFWTGFLSVLIGMIMASAFPAILVYATELLPGKVGLVAGLFFGFAFGMAGLGSAILGRLADATSIYYVFSICSFLPLIGILTGFLPNLRKRSDV
jgi:FSR family fosmidomycin resistance protein-like MFS transporter